jgi:hypothetical protein
MTKTKGGTGESRQREAANNMNVSVDRLRNQRPQDPDNNGHFLLALDPKAFRRVRGRRRCQLGRPARNVAPGDSAAAARALRLAGRVPIPPAPMEKLKPVCERCGAPLAVDKP